MMDDGYSEMALEMVELVKCPYSRRQIEDAGDALKGVMSAYTDGAAAVFKVAHAWRDAHVVPMQKLRRELGWATKKIGANGSINAARLKRMKSIRKKLRNTPLTLYQIQDIAGCRAILDSMDELEQVLAIYRAGRFKHGVIKEFPYISEPKADGYRSHHLALKFAGDGKYEIFNRQRVEVQLRTRLQHAWATAVEAAGLVLGQDLKGGAGDADWLRLFAIMASEIACEEDQPGIPGVANSERERRQELRDLERRLDAARNLKTWNEAIKETEKVANSRSMFYLIQFDKSNPARLRTSVKPIYRFEQGSEELQAEERNDENRDTVIVETDGADDLREAYPNYFLDVTIFNNRLRAALEDKKPTPLAELYPRRSDQSHIVTGHLGWLRWLAGRR
jgi:hypothetical protein